MNETKFSQFAVESKTSNFETLVNEIGFDVAFTTTPVSVYPTSMTEDDFQSLVTREIFKTLPRTIFYITISRSRNAKGEYLDEDHSCELKNFYCQTLSSNSLTRVHPHKEMFSAAVGKFVLDEIKKLIVGTYSGGEVTASMRVIEVLDDKV